MRLDFFEVPVCQISDVHHGHCACLELLSHGVGWSFDREERRCNAFISPKKLYLGLKPSRFLNLRS